MDHFQVPFSVITVWRPAGGSASRVRVKHRPYLDGVWDFPQGRAGGDAVFPPELCNLLVESFTSPGDLVVDPTCGRGSLLSTAASAGRRAVGYEIDPALIPDIEANGIEVVQ
jgi:DNA modification methylase